MTIGGLGHGRTVARCLEESRIQVIRQHGYVTRTDCQRTRVYLVGPLEADFHAREGSEGVAFLVVQHLQAFGTSERLGFGSGTRIDGDCATRALQSPHRPQEERHAG